MILTIYLTLLVISFIIIALGYTAEADLFKFTGYTLLFLVSCVSLFSSVEFVNGYSSVVLGNTTTITPNYSTLSSTTTLFNTFTYRLFAFLQVIAAIGGFIFTLGERGREHD
jgi:hypothetical protein